MRKEYWRVILYTKHDTYAGHETFDAKWKAEQYIKEQKGRIVEYYAVLQHWKQESEERIDIASNLR